MVEKSICLHGAGPQDRVAHVRCQALKVDIKEVAAAFGVDEDMIEGKGQRNNMARNAAIYFVQRYTGLKNEEIGEIFGGIHYSAVSKASWRLQQEMADN